MSRKAPRKGLTPDDQEVWQRVAKTVERVDLPSFGDLLGETKPQKSQPDQTHTPLQPFEIKGRKAPSISVSLAPHPGEALKTAPAQMDRKNYDRLRKGKMSPDRKIDLHGMTADVAQTVLTQVLLSAHSQGARLVLVITGKGRSGSDEPGFMPARRGIIRHSVPDWLRRAPLRDKVLQVIPAHRKHGGDGAYYVYLRRRR